MARGGFGMFYDRPQGNQVFDLITNPPGLQSTTLQWGLAKDISPTGALYAPVGLNPNVYEWKTPVVYQWNIGVQWKMPADFVLDVSYVGSESRDLLQQRQINALPYGTAYLASSQDPTRGQTCTGCSASSTLPGGNALPTDLLRSAYPGYSAVRMWEFSAYANYKALQTTISRRFYKGLMFSANYTASSAKGIAGGDWDGARIDGKDREANYGPLGQDRPHAFVDRTSCTRCRGWRTARWATSPTTGSSRASTAGCRAPRMASATASPASVRSTSPGPTRALASS